MILDYMKKGYRTEFITENYVSSPPALFIIDEYSNTFTLGNTYQDDRDRPQGHYAFNILFNGINTGIFASHIERRNGKIRAFTGDRTWKIWNGRSFT